LPKQKCQNVEGNCIQRKLPTDQVFFTYKLTPEGKDATPFMLAS